MELTGKLKEEVEKAKTKEEVKEAFEKAGISLSDDELDNVSGGYKTKMKQVQPMPPLPIKPPTLTPPLPVSRPSN